jgi:hypothetical protein
MVPENKSKFNNNLEICQKIVAVKENYDVIARNRGLKK